jgi:ribosomal protein S18 acetylase RimI-like enzyme
VIAVRRATPADARAIAEIHVETWRAAYAGVMPQEVLDELDVEARELLWRSWAAAPDGATFVAEPNGRIVGFAGIGPSRDPEGVGEVYSIYVLPAAWGTGAGRALMDAGAAWLKERWSEAVLWVAEENPRARRFYERYGWALDGGRKVDEVAPGAVVAEVRYRLSGLERL